MYIATIKSKEMVKDYIKLIVEFSDGTGENDPVGLTYEIKTRGDYELVITDTLRTECDRLTDLKNLSEE
jgi:hypothetical protein